MERLGAVDHRDAFGGHAEGHASSSAQKNATSCGPRFSRSFFIYFTVPAWGPSPILVNIQPDD